MEEGNSSVELAMSHGGSAVQRRWWASDRSGNGQYDAPQRAPPSALCHWGALARCRGQSSSPSGRPWGDRAACKGCKSGGGGGGGGNRLEARYRRSREILETSTMAWPGFPSSGQNGASGCEHCGLRGGSVTRLTLGYSFRSVIRADTSDGGAAWGKNADGECEGVYGPRRDSKERECRGARGGGGSGGDLQCLG